MNSPDRRHPPFTTLLAIELHTVGLAIAREAALAAAALASVCILSAVTALRYREGLDALPELMLGALPVALLLPWIVWKGDPPFGRALLWTLPVRRQQAAIAKIAAGGLWLMLAVLATLLALIATALVTGGSIGVDEMRLVGPFSQGFEGASPVRWATPLWMWAVPFGAVLTVYLASSAALLGLRNPVRWLAGTGVAAALLIVLAVNLGPHSAVQEASDRFIQTVISGHFGLDFAVTGGVAALSEDVDVPGPGSRELWRALPDIGRWAAALVVWLGAALLALALALRRHWER
jgi:hypothetical protein